MDAKGLCHTCNNRRLAQVNPMGAYRRHKDAKLRLKYKITLAEFEGMVAAQGNACAICRRGPEDGRKGRVARSVGHSAPTLCIDHDHKTGRVRELLCQLCNYMIGCASDSPERLEAGAAYLRRHGAVMPVTAETGNGCNPTL